MATVSAIIMGDTTTHGGRVITASSVMFIDSRAVAVVGDLVSCPKCNGNFAIIGGGPVIESHGFFMGKDVAYEGMLTSCGAKLIGSQTRFVFTTADDEIGAVSPVNLSDNENGYDEQVLLNPDLTEGMPYFIETKDGKMYHGVISELGKLPRVYTEGEEDYLLYLGDEALAKIEGIE